MIQPLQFIKLIANDLRWQMVQQLSISDYRVHELADMVQQPMNAVSYHLKLLREGDLVTTRRSDADARDVYYSLNLDTLRQLYQAAGAGLHPALAGDTVIQDRVEPLRVLFVCTHNSARSQLAEALLRHHMGEQAAVYSAGSHPTRVHPDAVRVMDELGIDIRQQQSEHLSQYKGQHFDYVITVCDNARETCPSFPGGQQIHWGFSDPLTIEDKSERLQTLRQIAVELQRRTYYLRQEWTAR